MKTLMTVLSVLIFGLSTAAFADCTRDGRTYKTGDKVGPFTCMANGSWKR